MRCSTVITWRLLIRRIPLDFRFFKTKTAYEISACLVGSEMGIRDRRKKSISLKRIHYMDKGSADVRLLQKEKSSIPSLGQYLPALSMESSVARMQAGDVAKVASAVLKSLTSY